MALKLPKAENRYDKNNEQTTRQMLEAEDLKNLKVGFDIDLGSGAVGLILRSPDGTRWRLGIGNTGALVTTSI